MDDGTTQPWRQIITCSRERIARAPNENLETLPLATSACARQNSVLAASRLFLHFRDVRMSAFSPR
jgi:hypothetical protein